MAADKEGMMRTTFWLERTLLIGLLYFAVEGDKKHFLPILAGLILHDFIVFIAKDVVYSSLKAAQSLDLDRWKLIRSSNPRDINLIRSGNNKVIDKNLKQEGEGDPEIGATKNHEHVVDEGNMHHIPCEKCKMVLEEAKKVKEKYKEKYKKKLMEKEDKFKKDKSSLKDKYNEDREKWEEEMNLLKKKYEEMRWT